jgi:hypothetical protein
MPRRKRVAGEDFASLVGDLRRAREHILAALLTAENKVYTRRVPEVRRLQRLEHELLKLSQEVDAAFCSDFSQIKEV